MLAHKMRETWKQSVQKWLKISYNSLETFQILPYSFRITFTFVRINLAVRLRPAIV